MQKPRILVVLLPLILSICAVSLTPAPVNAIERSCGWGPPYSGFDAEMSVDCYGPERFSEWKCTTAFKPKTGTGNVLPFPLKSSRGFKQYCSSDTSNFWIRETTIKKSSYHVCLGVDLTGLRATHAQRMRDFTKKGYDYEGCFKPAFDRLKSVLANRRFKELKDIYPGNEDLIQRGCVAGTGGLLEPIRQTWDSLGCDYYFAANVKLSGVRAILTYRIAVELNTTPQGSIVRTVISTALGG